MSESCLKCLSSSPKRRQVSLYHMADAKGLIRDEESMNKSALCFSNTSSTELFDSYVCVEFGFNQ